MLCPPPSPCFVIAHILLSSYTTTYGYPPAQPSGEIQSLYSQNVLSCCSRSCLTRAFGSPRRLLGFYNCVKDHRGSSSMATRVQIYGGNWYFTHILWGGERIRGRVLVWFADPAPVPAVQHLALLLVFSASRALSPFVSFRFVSFRFVSLHGCSACSSSSNTELFPSWRTWIVWRLPDSAEHGHAVVDGA